MARTSGRHGVGCKTVTVERTSGFPRGFACVEPGLSAARSRRTGYLAVPGVAAFVLSSAVASAADFCVTTGPELQSALSAAASNGEDDFLRLRAGTYAVSAGAVAFAVINFDNFSLNITGGYFEVGPIACLFGAGPTATVLSGSGVRAVLQLAGASGTNGDLNVRNLTIANGLNSDGSAGGLRIGGFANYTGDILIERVIFDNNVSTTFGGGLSGGTDGGTFTLRNSVFSNNRASINGGAASIANNATSAASYRAFVGNNTFAANACTLGAPPSCNNGGIRLGGNARYVVYNNAFAFNAGIDLQFPDNGDLYNNNVPTLSGTPDAMSGNLAFADPGFVSVGVGNYRLMVSSPLRNAGTASFDTGSLDNDGSPRLNDDRYDIGAYENQAILFRGSFESLP